MTATQKIESFLAQGSLLSNHTKPTANTTGSSIPDGSVWVAVQHLGSLAQPTCFPSPTAAACDIQTHSLLLWQTIRTYYSPRNQSTYSQQPQGVLRATTPLTHLDGIFLQYLLLLELQLLLSEATAAAATACCCFRDTCTAACLVLVPVMCNKEHHPSCCEDQDGVAWPMAGSHQLQLCPRPAGIPVA